MDALTALTSRYNNWIEAVAQHLASLLLEFQPAERIELMEAPEGTLEICSNDATSAEPSRPRLTDLGIEDASGALASLLSRRQVELTLRAERFLLRPLDLPAKASEFLGGIVRSQLDRLTPWDASQAVFGWSEPQPASDDRISVMVAAAERESISCYARSLIDCGATSVTVLVGNNAETDEGSKIRVLEERSANALDARKIARKLNHGLLGVIAALAVLVTSSLVLSDRVLQQQQELSQKLARARAEKSKSDQTGATLEQGLWRKKFEIPPTVLVLEHLSQTLPDTTFLTSLQIEANKVRFSGSSRNAPGLIELLERSQHFSRATFYAPTTRASSGAAERFQIEAVSQALAPRKPL